MATNGVKKVSVEMTASQCVLAARALDVIQDQIKRSLAKESDPVIIERRKAQIEEARVLANNIMYGGKELV